ncbi:hypothetical protein EI168_09655 [Halomonas sp. FME1]|uniref:Uncharacterized protein n=1 Tax=Halomonas casei TaxID=2742613 RepID=A0ABR9F1M8_9GAMM|nr:MULTISPECIES: hypothetical protein [Halomonas]MBE0400373.1 hypothetical protein [Halomonas casei]
MKRTQERLAALEQATPVAGAAMCLERLYDPEHPTPCDCPQTEQGGLDAFYATVEKSTHE